MKNEDEIKKIKAIILHLENVSERYLMYVGKEDEWCLVTYLNGFETACEMHRTYLDGKIIREVEKERGWRQNSPTGIWSVMRQQGLSAQETIRELLTIRILSWQRTLLQSQEAT